MSRADDMVAVAMSGGLDSSVAAWMLSRRGEPVVGLSMLLWDQSERRLHGRCCGALDLGDARRVAAQCSIPHYTLRMEEEFRRAVVDPFVSGYLEGETPVPCTSCNTWIKFGLLLEKARSLGASRLATGHYARIERGVDGWELHRALCEEKDQSYYLFELTQEQLGASLFPLGGLSKRQVRERARRVELVVAEKGESMELCFVSGGVREFVAAQAAADPERFGAPPAEGATLTDRSGRKLGRGAPYYRYTVGQRRGLGVASAAPLYVLEILPEENRLVVGEAEELLRGDLVGERVHWIGTPPESELACTVRIRARHAGVGCRVHPGSGGRVEVELETPQRGVAPGQAAVFYDGGRVLGGAWIAAA